MLASELAQELNIDPSLMSKRLVLYFAEIGEVRPRILDAQTIGHVRHAHELIEARTARSFKAAIQIVLGTFAVPVPPEIVQRLDRRLDQIETVQTQVLERVTQIQNHLEALMARRAAANGQPSQ